jgi:head-tail adaptor
MIDPGRLKTRLQIQAPIETADGQGGVARSYATLTTAWAQVTPLAARGGGGGADVEAGADGAVARYRILLRSNFVLTLQHRLADGARIYRISGIRDHDDRRFIAVDAELRVE